MTKLRWLILLMIFLPLSFYAAAQGYGLHIRITDRDSSAFPSPLRPYQDFDTRTACVNYINRLPDELALKGYVTASLDSVQYDSSAARVVLYMGDQYRWDTLRTSGIDASVLSAAGLRPATLTGQPMDFRLLSKWQNDMIGHLENNGYPFARIYVDSLTIDGEKVNGTLRMDKGPIYKIDSIRVYGDAKVSNEFLQRYLDLRNGALFSKEKLLRISRRLRELNYIEEEQPPKLIWLNSGSVIDLYLKPKKSSQVNVLVGFLPNNDQLSSRKLLITGEANLLLRNALGSGETIGLNWQQLQVKSPRLNLLYQHPYIFNSAIGLDFSFDMFRKDSTFLNVNFQIGAQYVLDIHQAGKLFLQRTQSIVNGVNKNYILQNYRLSDEADVSATNVGLDYEYNNTNYRLNPVSGTEFRVIAAAGIKKLRKNNEILELKDPANPGFDFGSLYDTIKLKTYQLRLRIAAARYFLLGGQMRSTLKTGVNAGMFQSGNTFRNELFQIGGYKLLRGFDEESQYLSQFAIGTAEYRYLVGQNSFLYAFVDGGWGQNKSQNTSVAYGYFGTGLGLAFETSVGVFNLAWAIGKRSDAELNLRQSKVHFGFVSFF